MNTYWFKQNRLLVTFVVVFVIVFGFVGWKLWGQYVEYQQIQNDLDQKLSQLQQLQNSNPTPTDNNVTLSDENHKRLLEAQHGLYPLLLRIAKVQPTRISSNIEFAQDLRKTIARMEDKTKGKKIVIPPDFRFGFKRYASAIPKKGLAKPMLERLGKQLLVVEDLVNLMIESRVEQFYAIKRIEIEPLDRGQTLGEDALPDAPAVHAQDHYISMPFELHFACSARALQGLLNRIATADKFFVVRLLTVEQEVIEKKPEEIMVTTDGQTTADTESKAVVQAPERSPRLRVNIKLDFIEMLPPKAAARDPMTRNR